MTALAIVWLYALVALQFCGVAAVQRRAPTRLVPPWLLTVALLATALWALALAGIGEGDFATRVAASVRNLAWLAVLATFARAAGPGAGRWGTAAYLATAASMGVAAIATGAQALAGAAASRELMDTALALRMLSTAAALVLAHRVLLYSNSRTRGGRHAAVAALALMWSADLILFLVAYATQAWPQPLSLARGAVMAMVAPMIAVAVHRDGDWSLRMSRTLVMQGVLVAAAALYAFATAVATGMLAGVGGEKARMVQTAFVFGTTTALLTIVSTPWLRAWTRVVVAKHLFAHRYDYRAEWMRFTETLGAPGDAANPLAVRVVKAMADLTDSPAGLLLLADEGLRAGEAWNWEPAPAAAGDAALARHLETTRRIIDLDAVRAATAPPEESAVTPDWLTARGDAWALVPLMHGERLVGAIALARPTVDRALDWEDFDLLGVAGRQAASYLAEDRAHAALAEARRFDEFNRRFAFILHDLKNLVSQTALVARNAERHADNPAFRADMIETLRDTSQRMTTLLSRLSRNAAAPADAVCAVPVRALLDRLAEARRAQHPVVALGEPALAAEADPAALETVLTHLLQNAVEASAPGVPVTLSVEAGGGEVAIHVADRGAGMSAAFVRDDLFAPFVSRKPGGFGLGAYEARQLVAAMRGRLAVDTREGAGTRFTVTLPLAVSLPQMLEQAA